MKDYKVSISLRTLLIVILAGLSLFLAYELRTLLLSVFFAYIINAGLRPIVDRLESRRVKRGFAIAITYIVFFLIIFVLGFLVFSSAFTQFKSFFGDIDQKIINFANFIQINAPFLSHYIDLSNLNAENISGLFSNLGSEGANATLLQLFNVVGNQGVSIISGVVNALFSFIVIIMISIYMLTQKDYVYKPLIKLLPAHLEKRLDPVLDKIEASLGAWLGGQLILMLSVGVITYVILIVPGLFDSAYPLSKYALVLAIIAGILEGIPNIGPIITMAVALVAAILSGAGVPVVLFILIAFILLQQLEGILIVPVVMRKALDLHPILSIIGAVAGLELGGPVGALLSIPIVATIQIVVLEVSKSYRLKKD